jgi:hypothetical protein
MTSAIEGGTPNRAAKSPHDAVTPIGGAGVAVQNSASLLLQARPVQDRTKATRDQ